MEKFTVMLKDGKDKVREYEIRIGSTSSKQAVQSQYERLIHTDEGLSALKGLFKNKWDEYYSSSDYPSKSNLSVILCTCLYDFTARNVHDMKFIKVGSCDFLYGFGYVDPTDDFLYLCIYNISLSNRY